MGVQPPAVVPARPGTPGSGQVVALEPRTTGAAPATLVARDARTGAEIWSRPVASTFGPTRCGPYVCLAEATATRAPRLVALDPASGGRPRWRLPGLAEVQWSDAERAIVFRMGARPTLESCRLSDGRRLWAFPVERAVGRGLSLSGGWSFGVNGGVLVGSIAPYQSRAGGRLSAYGFFGLRVSDGRPVWTRTRLLRVHPSPHPSVALIGREVDTASRYAGFVVLDPRSGATVAKVPAERVPRHEWWPALPTDLSALAFLTREAPGTAIGLRPGASTAPGTAPVWSFCTADPEPLPITGQRGFYPAAALCAYDLATGRRASGAGAPPSWYTGAADGRVAWRDERGALHAARVPAGSPSTLTGMLG